jgi:alpha-tubulin suppressor-like RCC1 family protein
MAHELRTWGSGTYGRLGLGTCEDVDRPTTVENIPRRTTAVASKPPVLSSQRTNDQSRRGKGGKLGGKTGGKFAQDVNIEGTREARQNPIPPRRFHSLSCGWYHSAATNNEGELITFGSSVSGCLGTHGGQMGLEDAKDPLDWTSSDSDSAESDASDDDSDPLMNSKLNCTIDGASRRPGVDPRRATQSLRSLRRASQARAVGN